VTPRNESTATKRCSTTYSKNVHFVCSN